MGAARGTRQHRRKRRQQRATATAVQYRRYRTVFTRPILSGYLTRINETRIVKLR